ncbi:hypothetical protein V5799_031911 [Amblyomma americanum]|uniref:Uncharacterized protein n=1 Tax=Amblyomma americanum TaxID=6943 RepID=A0AAQ4DSP3_AMBAM
MFEQFCGMKPEDNVALLKCLGEKLPDVVKELEEKGYNLGTLQEKVCGTDEESFPFDLMLNVGKALPYVAGCLPLQNH